MSIINDKGFYETPIMLLLVLLIVHIGICLYLYLTHKKYPEANGKMWFVINLFFPLCGMFGYIINRIITTKN